ncbi:MAG: hypothetical protein RL150_478 [Candidatus Parcubacteria bacterium]|jgi:cytoskeletal protein CcmA (bactofilin family)
MWRSWFAFLLLFAASLLPIPAFAAGVQVGSDTKTDASATFPDNQYLVGGSVEAAGTFTQDLFIAGGRVQLPGTVDGDVLILAGESAVITGNVRGDVRVIGGTVTVEGTVAGDVVLLGGTLLLSPEATISGEVLAVGGHITVGSTLHKHARIVAVATMITGEITTSANITTERLTFADTARVPGAVVYFSPREADIAATAVVEGSVTFNRVESIRESGAIERAVLNFLNFWIVLRFVTTLILTFLLVYLFRVFSQRTTEYVLMSFGRSVLTGLLTVVVLPVVALILFLSLLLMPVAVLVMFAYIFFFIIASAVSSIAVGALVKRIFVRGAALEVSFKTAALGVVLLTVVQFVPLVGEATRIVFFLAAFGAICRYLYTQVRWRELTLFEKR